VVFFKIAQYPDMGEGTCRTPGKDEAYRIFDALKSFDE
jgi:hypothetical protein